MLSPLFLTPSKSKHNPQPCCHAAWVAPQAAGGTLLEGGAEEAEMQTVKATTREGSLETSFYHVLSLCPYYPLFCFVLNPPEKH